MEALENGVYEITKLIAEYKAGK
ncbi:hypothetical protein QCM8_228 [Bacillus phage QCM8]|nr:hypothetical protein QCM8_228 [Bacillus phage QCM8]UGO47787.1 hypothetical protein MCCARTNEY_213 [Bacillus phage vB_BanH_McCartney]